MWMIIVMPWYLAFDAFVATPLLYFTKCDRHLETDF
jgi:hypothetical protein